MGSSNLEVFLSKGIVYSTKNRFSSLLNPSVADLKATEAVLNLHNKEVPFSAMQKAFSVGAIGTKNKRKLVPTRWSITACDSTLADEFLKEVRKFERLDTYRVFEFGALNNYYIIIL